MNLRLTNPSNVSENDTYDFINEFINNSEIYGCSGLNRYLNDREGWLNHLLEVSRREVTEESVPGYTYFLVNENNYPIGICNIRPYLNETLRRFGGHIGYSIRPSQRGNGYNNINLYLALEILNTYGVDEALLDCTVSNIASDSTIRRLGGILQYTDIDPYDNTLTNVYSINIQQSLLNNEQFNGRGEQNETNRTINRI